MKKKQNKQKKKKKKTPFSKATYDSYKLAGEGKNYMSALTCFPIGVLIVFKVFDCYSRLNYILIWP
jgi:hypothetical protein